METTGPRPAHDHDHNPSPRKKLKIEEEEEEGKDNVEDAEEDENEKNHGEVDEDDREERDDDDDDNNGEKKATMDGLSSLPCHLLERILSYLPTKSVVATALLSRRWRYLWASALHLDFDDFDVPRCGFANALLSFRLALRHNCSHLTVSRWLRNADLFHLASLRILRLTTSSYALPVNWPVSARLPSLDTLELVGLRFYPSVAADFVSSACPRLRSCLLKRCQPLPSLDVNCPLLEELSLANFHRCKLQDLRITAGRLKRLSVTNAFAVNVEMTLAISAPSIESFRWCGVTPREYRAASPTSPLRSQVVSLPRMFRKFHRVGCPVNLLQAFAD
ncbi:F-box protein At4g09920-like [Ananas comosus]|uniref:F-box protein At4g09920-like n=1 Tax=Ananas comosus TaxID=4615 RepID=A0A6P5FHY8_ANACO|nr:F-box protein At4g09920-like [Ananas comosus]